MIPPFPLLAVTVGLAAGVTALANTSISQLTVTLDPTIQYLLPPSFSGNDSNSFFQTTDAGDQLSATASAPVISYATEFTGVVGSKPTFELVAKQESPFAIEMGIWVSDHNQIWFTGPTINNVSSLTVLDLSTNSVYFPNTSIEIKNPNGGYYHGSKVYVAGDGNATVPPSIYAVDPVTLHTSVVANSYFGLRFGGPNDMTAVVRGGKSYVFFTDDPLSSLYNGGLAPQLPDAVWRLDLQDQSLVPVIDRTDVLVPNGIRVNREQNKLYVTDTPPPSEGGDLPTASAAIYVFDLDENAFPSNRRLFGLAERGIPDGIKLDDAGRVWTGEGDGIVVRNSGGKLIGLFNALAILPPNATSPLQNFALAGDTLVILAETEIWKVKLAQTVVDPGLWP